jgi:hypothetical protein
MEFQFPDAPSGTVRNVINYGATPDNSTDNDATAIQSAINASSVGDSVYIPAGNFHLKTALSVKSGVTLSGESKTTTHLFAHATALRVITIPSGASNINIENLHITCDKSVTYNMGIEISTKSGSNAYRIAIRNVDIDTFEMRGINVRQAHHVYIENCHMHDATNLGDGGYGYGITLNDTNNNNNWVTGCTLGPVLRHGLLVQYSAHNNLIEHCEAFQNTLDAYDLHGEDEHSNEFRFNIARNGGGAGFGFGNTGSTHIDSGPNNWVHDNEVYGIPYAVTIINGSHNQIIERNYFHDISDTGIRSYDQTTTDNIPGGGNNLIIRNNFLKNCRIGVRLDVGTNIQITGNIIVGSSLHGIAVPTIYTNGFVIKDNDLRFCTNGAFIFSGATGTFENNLTGTTPMAPCIYAGDDQTVLGTTTTVDLNGIVVDDGSLPANGSPELIWSVLSGPGTVSFSDSAITNPEITFSKPGTYTLQLEAIDSDNNSVSDSVSINVNSAENDIWIDTALGKMFFGFYPYVYHTEHHWFYFNHLRFDGFDQHFIYYYDMDSWTYMDKNYYPYLYAYERAAWLRYWIKGTPGSIHGTRKFYDYTLGEIFYLPYN